MCLHYQIAGRYHAEAHLIGSNKLKKGIELFGGDLFLEKKKDFEKPKRAVNLPYWVIPDTKGIL